MNLENGVLVIDSSLDNLQIEEMLEDIKNNIEQINEVIVEPKSIASSALFALLGSIKKTNSNISIPILEHNRDIEGFGNTTFIQKD
ncbi:MAG: hypothetical protein PHF17_06415 [Arcobacteraceae bacterium]|nr:hypothetical protein [Arcobacteraceae bacterium]